MSELNSKATPEVSIIIPTRDRRDWLEEAINSVLLQTGVSWELIIVDHRSTDGTAEYLATLTAPCIRSLRCTDGDDRAAPANAGLALARGKWAMFLDSDDLLSPGALLRLVEAIRNDREAVAVVGARYDWFCDGRNDGRRDSHPRFSCRRWISEELLFGWSAVSGQVLYCVEILRKTGGYRAGDWPCDDRDLWLRVAALGPVRIVPEIVMKYRVHPSQFRPGDLEAIRERVYHRAIRERPRKARRPLLEIRVASRHIALAEICFRGGDWMSGFRSVITAVTVAPRIFLSPLIGLWACRRLARRVWHRLRGI